MRIQSIAIALLTLLAISCSASEATSLDIFEENVPNYSERHDLSDIDTVDETELEIIRILTEGHVMYRRMELTCPPQTCPSERSDNGQIEGRQKCQEKV